MMIIDSHTHFLRHNALVNIAPGDHTTPGYTYSCGIHPWRLAEASRHTWELLENTLRRSEIVAVGETGIDALRGVSVDAQRAAFMRHIALSETLGMPLIIHCVRAWQDIISIKKQLNPKQPWIMHGFRLKPTIAQQLVEAGMYLSLGARFNADSARIIPPQQLLIETDDAPETTIESVAQAVAAARDETVGHLLDSIHFPIGIK